jgi:hypothetical protein
MGQQLHPPAFSIAETVCSPLVVSSADFVVGTASSATFPFTLPAAKAA